MTQIMSLSHLIKILTKENIKIKNIDLCKHNTIIDFETDIGIKHNTLIKYNIITTHCSCKYYVYTIDHMRFIANLKNILSKYKNAKNSLHKHKQEIDAKIEYYEQMVWKKNNAKFNKEMKNLDIAKYELWLQYGSDMFKLQN